MTNHSYFNLAGDPSKASTDNILYVNADYYTPVDSSFMTTGEIAPVKDTPMDFTTPKAVGKEIDNYDFVQLKNGKGYDHNWVLNTKGDLSQVAAKLTSPESGITLEVYTNVLLCVWRHNTILTALTRQSGLLLYWNRDKLIIVNVFSNSL